MESVTGTKLIVPVISRKDEAVQRHDEATIHIRKRDGVLVVKATGGKATLSMEPDRVFNLVPGVQGLVFSVDLQGQGAQGGAGIELSVA
jgi:hypothetical protein